MHNNLETNLQKPKVRAIAFYLPQYHPIPENDEWWCKGFTEWTNVTKAKPLFPGHYQPDLPSDLGFYDLRVPETRIAQAELARAHGIEGFCYWHYWFGNGKRILDRPFNEVLKSGQPNFPFCLGWANHTWSGIWDGCPNRILIQQTYPGKDDYKAHFETVVEAFKDERYMKINGQPIFLIFSPKDLPNPLEFTDYWRELAIESGFPGIYFIGLSSNPSWNPSIYGFDAFSSHPPKDIINRLPESLAEKVFRKVFHKKFKEFLRDYFSIPCIYSYQKLVDYVIPDVSTELNFLPCIVPNWDNTPRSGVNGIVFRDPTPELFRKQLNTAITRLAKNNPEERIVFIKSWNEWAEGNYLEPSRRFGKAFLEVIKQEIQYPPIKKPQKIEQQYVKL
ncbi:MAG: glycoside hydrolase family 99-like domain-containing protein [Aulosira sp. DedQUE10]|nr:glycoside hydrolase family 99-like domain-containing protein [Aulosira sp. DedQUE10]